MGMKQRPQHDYETAPTFETADLRANLKAFYSTPYHDPIRGADRAVGSFQWGVYAFFDYDGEPIYVGQTKEKLSGRIGRHLTNQRTDAVAMSVLDPFEVYEIAVWPLPTFEHADFDKNYAATQLNALERAVYERALAESKFGAVLNEKAPPDVRMEIDWPVECRGRVVSDGVAEIRSHPDFRVARRALVMSRLAQVIAERQVKSELREVLVTQSKRLLWLAERRFDAVTKFAP